MEPEFFRYLPRNATVFYALIILCLLVLAFVAHDEFGYSALPVLYATSPLSGLLYHSGFNFLFSIFVGAVINGGVLFAFLKGIAFFRASNEPK